METRDRASCDSVEEMKAKKKRAGKTNPAEPSKPLLVDEEVFTDLITKMVNTPPMPLKDVPRRRNPETDPRYLPVFPAMEKKTGQ
ncbi:MAG: hypothetical protein WCC04_05565 [Terriglobales bacterium]